MNTLRNEYHPPIISQAVSKVLDAHKWDAFISVGIGIDVENTFDKPTK